jgi:hypothetical protein
MQRMGERQLLRHQRICCFPNRFDLRQRGHLSLKPRKSIATEFKTGARSLTLTLDGFKREPQGLLLFVGRHNQPDQRCGRSHQAGQK